MKGIISVVVFSFVLVFGMTSVAGADIIQYDNGLPVVGYANWGLYYANRFTNELSQPVSVNGIELVHLFLSGYGDSVVAWFWQDNAGVPGIGTNVGTYTFATSWPRIDVSGQGIVLAPGESIFAGIDPVGNCQVIYDNMNPGAGHSWWLRNSTSSWQLGGPLNERGNLILRLDVTPLPVPEPATASLLALGLGCVLSRRFVRRG